METGSAEWTQISTFLLTMIGFIEREGGSVGWEEGLVREVVQKLAKVLERSVCHMKVLVKVNEAKVKMAAADGGPQFGRLQARSKKLPVLKSLTPTSSSSSAPSSKSQLEACQYLSISF